MRNLMEGMRSGDLEDLVLPLLSLDEYESKIDEDAIVIGFFVSEHSAAEDLNRFLQRSPVELLDTEISPAPDAQGYFMVFVELLNNTKLADNVEDILEEVAALSNIENWKMQVRGAEELTPFSTEAVMKAVGEPKANPVQESVLAFLTRSDLADARFEAGKLVLEGRTSQITREIVGFGLYAEVAQRHDLLESPMALDLATVAANKAFCALLGEGWSVSTVAGVEVLQRFDRAETLVLKA